MTASPSTRRLGAVAAATLLGAGLALFGAQSASAATLTVGAGGAYATIGAAVAAATAGDVIQIEAGSYSENVAVPTAVALEGAGAADVTITGQLTLDAPVTLSGVTITSPTWVVKVNAGGAGSEIHDVVIDGQGTAVQGVYATGANASAATPTRIHDSTFVDAGYSGGGAIWAFDSGYLVIANNEFTASAGAVGINVGNGSSHVTISGNSFTDLDNAVVLIAGSPTAGPSEDVTITGNTVDRTTASAIYVGGSNVTGLTVSDNTFTDVGSSAVQFAAGYPADPDAWIIPGAPALDDVVISGNDVVSAEYGITVGEGVLLAEEGSVTSTENTYRAISSGVAIRSLATDQPALVSDGDDLGTATVAGPVSVAAAPAPEDPELVGTGVEPGLGAFAAGGALLLGAAALLLARRTRRRA